MAGAEVVLREPVVPHDTEPIAHAQPPDSSRLRSLAAAIADTTASCTPSCSIVEMAAAVVPFGDVTLRRSTVCAVSPDVSQERGRPEDRVVHHALRRRRIEAEILGCGDHRLGKEEDVRRPAARHRRDGVLQRLGDLDDPPTDSSSRVARGAALGTLQAAAAADASDPRSTRAGVFGMARTTLTPAGRRAPRWPTW